MASEAVWNTETIEQAWHGICTPETFLRNCLLRLFLPLRVWLMFLRPGRGGGLIIGRSLAYSISLLFSLSLFSHTSWHKHMLILTYRDAHVNTHTYTHTHTHTHLYG